MDKPKIYLDIDGVLVANARSLANHAEEFVHFLVDNFDVYWLTTHCTSGDPTWAIEYVDNLAEGDLSEVLEEIEPTSWSLKKTEAIDFDEPFIWFDDMCFSEEKADLEKHNALNSWREIDLSTDPDQLLVEMKELEDEYL